MIDYEVLKKLVSTTFNENPKLSVNRIIPKLVNFWIGRSITD